MPAAADRLDRTMQAAAAGHSTGLTLFGCLLCRAGVGEGPPSSCAAASQTSRAGRGCPSAMSGQWPGLAAGGGRPGTRATPAGSGSQADADKANQAAPSATAQQKDKQPEIVVVMPQVRMACEAATSPAQLGSPACSVGALHGASTSAQDPLLPCALRPARCSVLQSCKLPASALQPGQEGDSRGKARSHPSTPDRSGEHQAGRVAALEKQLADSEAARQRMQEEVAAARVQLEQLERQAQAQAEPQPDQVSPARPWWASCSGGRGCSALLGVAQRNGLRVGGASPVSRLPAGLLKRRPASGLHRADWPGPLCAGVAEGQWRQGGPEGFERVLKDVNTRKARCHVDLEGAEKQQREAEDHVLGAQGRVDLALQALAEGREALVKADDVLATHRAEADICR